MARREGSGQGEAAVRDDVDCAEASAFMRPYVDGELAGVDRAAYERHIDGCENCRAAARFEGRFKAAVRGHLPRRQVPMLLEQRIRAAVAELPIAPRRWNWLTRPPVVPALAVAAVLVLVVGPTVKGRRSFVLDQARRTYQAELPMDVTGPDCGSVASWFRGRLDFPVHAPRMPAHVTCQGGRLVNVAERPAAYLVYRDSAGHRVSVLVFDPENAPIDGPSHRMVDGRDIFYGTGPGISTAAYQDRGLGYVVTADLDMNSLTKLVTTSFLH